MISSYHTSRRSDSSGQSLIEFSLVALPVLLVLVLGAVEFGQMVSMKNRMASAAREGARLYVRYDIDSSASGASTTIQTKVITPMMNSVVQGSDLSSKYKIVVSALTRLDGPNRTTSTPSNLDDDVIIIDKQFNYISGASTGSSFSRLGAVDTVLARNSSGTTPDTTKLLTLDYLSSGEKSVCVEIFRDYDKLTPVGALLSVAMPTELYDRCFF
jgi:hypothetical protein